ncbi:MAG: FHA domain-containing protein [Gammaproteobacteria bacterium]|nr:FHA domain-containing protein [Gammaproteobacteria bacterium]
MPRLILTHEGAVLREYRLEHERTTLGRKGHNNIVLDDPTVSGEHAAFLKLQHIYVEDLGSTNGVILNGKRVTKRQLNHGDVIRIGRHELKFIDESAQQFERTVVIAPESSPTKTPTPRLDPAAASANLTPPPVVAANANKRAFIKVLNGAKQGEQILLSKAYTTVGTPGVQVAVIAKRGAHYHLMQMSGVGGTNATPRLNNQPIGAESKPLKNGDVIEVASTKLQFVETN